MPLTPVQRKVELMLKGIPLTEIARRLNVTPQHVSQVVSGKRRSPTVEEAVAAAIGQPVERVFGRAA